MTKVTVYSAEWCPWCHKVIDFLKQNNVEFDIKDVDQPQNAKELAEKSGQTGIPVTDVGGELIVGFNVQKLKELLKLK
ncbi:hypothetical protein KKF81_03995 [Candidatus Micrarchaeota archaeon]|nr:hypothetical protein [Candidatus Micrarchaeota archaeon]MBU1166087.1 hypothetical protein [Candidatus Micrarchaeota archaeon]MBU1886665.1 hypothetical protein [Candidatus Micrarchaeota archaeon]